LELDLVSIRRSQNGKAGDPDHLWPENLDHQKPELNTYQLIIFTKDMKIGVMWSRCPAFALMMSDIVWNADKSTLRYLAIILVIRFKLSQS
jgi:hypothetical protein